MNDPLCDTQFTYKRHYRVYRLVTATVLSSDENPGCRDEDEIGKNREVVGGIEPPPLYEVEFLPTERRASGWCGGLQRRVSGERRTVSSGCDEQ